MTTLAQAPSIGTRARTGTTGAFTMPQVFQTPEQQEEEALRVKVLLDAHDRGTLLPAGQAMRHMIMAACAGAFFALAPTGLITNPGVLQVLALIVSLYVTARVWAMAVGVRPGTTNPWSRVTYRRPIGFDSVVAASATIILGVLAGAPLWVMTAAPAVVVAALAVTRWAVVAHAAREYGEPLRDAMRRVARGGQQQVS